MKYFRRYITVALLIVSITAVTAGIVAVDESAKRISLGQEQAVVVRGKNASVIQPASVTDIEPILKKITAVFRSDV